MPRVLPTSSRLALRPAVPARLTRLAAALGVVAVLAAPALAAAECGDALAALRPLEGAWTLSLDDGGEARLEVRGELGGCAVRFDTEGGELTSLVTWFPRPADRDVGVFAVNDRGEIFRGSGAIDGDPGQFRSFTIEGSVTTADGSNEPGRWTAATTEAGDLRFEFTSGSGSGGRRIAYRIVGFSAGTAPRRSLPTAPTASAPQPTPAPATEAPATESPATGSPATGTRAAQGAETGTASAPERIRVSSGRGGGSAANTTVSTITVESPMLVELEVGPIEQIPEGYAWTSRDLASYRLDGATFERIVVKRRTRRGRTDVEVTVYGSSESFTSEFLVDVQLLTPDGEPLGEGAQGKLYLGRTVGQQIEEGSVALPLRLLVPADELEEALASPDRPLLAFRIEALG